MKLKNLMIENIKLLPICLELLQRHLEVSALVMILRLFIYPQQKIAKMLMSHGYQIHRSRAVYALVGLVSIALASFTMVSCT